MTQFECLQSHLANLNGKLFVLRENPTPDRFRRYTESARSFLEWLRKSEANDFITFSQYRELSREYGQLADEFSQLNDQYISELFDDSSIECDSVYAAAEVSAPVAPCRVLRLHSLLVEVSAIKCPQLQKRAIAAKARRIPQCFGSINSVKTFPTRSDFLHAQKVLTEFLTIYHPAKSVKP